MKERHSTEIAQKMARLAPTYLPEWRFDPTAPDSGTVLATLVGDMLQDSQNRFGRALHKHKISYLNLFDKLKVEPIQAATSFVRFSPVVGVNAPVHIPRGTQLFGDDASGESDIVFETMHGITTVATELAHVYTSNGASDQICQLFPRGGSSSSENAEKAQFVAFDLSQDDLSRHELQLAFAGVLDAMDEFNVGLRIVTAHEEEAPDTAAALLSSGVQFALLDPEEGAVEIPNAQISLEGDVIRLAKKGYAPKPVLRGEIAYYVLSITSKTALPTVVTSMELCFAKSEIRPDAVWSGGVEQVGDKFLPFGAPMEIFSDCGIESASVFSKKGARIAMDFKLDFAIYEQKLPEYEEDLNLKIVMKRPTEMPKPVTLDIYADYVLLEYFSVEDGWKRLLRDEHTALLFNTSEKGDLRITFDCPMDMADAAESPDGYRMRLRLMKAEHLYQIPSKQYCPVISNLHFSYDYMNQAIAPHDAVLYNNFHRENVTEQFQKRRSVALFTKDADTNYAMHLGFTAPPAGTPFSLYFSLENRIDQAMDLTVEYLGPRGFEQIKVIDGTSGLRYSGAMLLLVPEDCVQATAFGKEGYWLRIVKHNDCAPSALPVVSGVYLNMAKVENHASDTRFYYLEDQRAPFQIQLAERNIIQMQVWVNEAISAHEDDQDVENWVLWQPRKNFDAIGRFYEMDLAAGTILFDRGVFQTYPVHKAAASIKVSYQSYHGAAANVPEGAIHTLSTAIPYVATAQNPIPAFGGYDGYNEKTSAAMISSLLRTRGRAVTQADYMDIIQQATYGVRRMKALSDTDQNGNPSPDAITVALLIDEYNRGGYIFSAIKDKVRAQLEQTSGVLPLGKNLILTQPYFLTLSVRLWLECDSMENSYDLQAQTNATIRKFIDPLDGGFEGRGWEIGVLPTVQQLLSYLGTRHPNLTVSHIAMTVQYGEEEYNVDTLVAEKVKNPFVMAVNGEHTIYMNLKTAFI